MALLTTARFGRTSADDPEDVLDDGKGSVTATGTSSTLATLLLPLHPAIRHLGLYPAAGGTLVNLRYAIGTADVNSFPVPPAGFDLPILYANAMLLQLFSTSGNIVVKIIQTG